MIKRTFDIGASLVALLLLSPLLVGTALTVAIESGFPAVSYTHLPLPTSDQV